MDQSKHKLMPYVKHHWIQEWYKTQHRLPGPHLKQKERLVLYGNPAWAALSKDEKSAAFRQWCANNYDKIIEVQDTNSIKGRARQMPPRPKRGPDEPAGILGCLLTWNIAPVQDENIQKLHGKMQTFPDDTIEFASAINDLQQQKLLQKMFEDFHVFITQQCDKYDIAEYSACMEMGRRTPDLGRVHYHCYLTNMNGRDPRVFAEIDCVSWSWEHRWPDVRISQVARNYRKKANILNEAHYYCQSSKIGQLFSETNHDLKAMGKLEAHWVVNLWKQHKLGHGAFLEDALAARVNYVRNAELINTVRKAEQARLVTELQERVQRLLAQNAKPYRVIPAVEEWKKQYSTELFGRKGRFDFLLLKGPSKMGKTKFAMSLFGADKTLYVDCQRATDPDLRDFVRGKHDCIIFDEAPPSFVINNKAIFQANSEGALCAQSQCNQHAYRVFLYQIALIVSTNVWIDEQDQSGDAQWLRANSYHVEVKTPLWIE